jgi:hypothetical protein
MTVHRPVRRLLALVSVMTALGAPAAVAAPFEERYPGLANSETSSPTVSTPNAILGAQPSSTQSVPTVSVSTEEGFDWGDAAIGAGAMLALSAIVAGGVLEVSRRRGLDPTTA